MMMIDACVDNEGKTSLIFHLRFSRQMRAHESFFYWIFPEVQNRKRLNCLNICTLASDDAFDISSHLHHIVFFSFPMLHIEMRFIFIFFRSRWLDMFNTFNIVASSFAVMENLFSVNVPCSFSLEITRNTWLHFTAFIRLNLPWKLRLFQQN